MRRQNVRKARDQQQGAQRVGDASDGEVAPGVSHNGERSDHRAKSGRVHGVHVRAVDHNAPLAPRAALAESVVP